MVNIRSPPPFLLTTNRLHPERGTTGGPSGAWICEGSALGLHVGALHCSRFGAWSTCWRPTKRMALQLVQHLVNIRLPPPFLLTTKRLHPGKGTASNGFVPKTLRKPNTHQAIFSTEPLRLHKRSFPCKTSSAGKTRRSNIVNGILAMNLISNCSIASNALISSVPLISS